MLSDEPTERDWQKVYTQGREAFRRGLLRSSAPAGGWQQSAWLEGFDAEADEAQEKVA